MKINVVICTFHSRVLRVLKGHKFHPYKLSISQILHASDYSRNIEFCTCMGIYTDPIHILKIRFFGLTT